MNMQILSQQSLLCLLLIIFIKWLAIIFITVNGAIITYDTLQKLFRHAAVMKIGNFMKLVI